MLYELERCVLRALQHSPRLADHPEALGAVASFVFNLGAGAYYRSTLRRKINEGLWEDARKEMKKWVWAGGRRLPGLIARRSEEAEYLDVA
jgi:lysozyme